MSKKATRRAARQAFPQAKNPPANAAKRSRTYGQQQKPQRRAAAPPVRSSKAKRAQKQASLRPPSLMRALRMGAIVTSLYLIMIIVVFKQPGVTIWGHIFLGCTGFVIYTAVAYVADKFSYSRRLRKMQNTQKDSSK